MALLTQNVDVPLAVGLHQEVDPAVVPVGALLLNENTEIGQSGRLRKRPGCAALPDATTTPAGTVAAGRVLWLGAYQARDELLRMRTESVFGPQGSRLLAYAEQPQKWIERAAVPSCTWARSSLVRRQTDLGRSRTQIALDPARRYRAVVWLEASALDDYSYELRFRVDDVDTGAVVVRERAIPQSSELTQSDGVFQLLYLDGRFVVIWYREQRPGAVAGPVAYSFMGWRFRTDTLVGDANPTSFVALDGACTGWDVCVVAGDGTIVLAWVDGSHASQLAHAIVQPRTWGFSAYANFALPDSNVIMVRCHAGEGGSAYHSIAWIANSLPGVAQFLNSTGASHWGVGVADSNASLVVDVYQRPSDDLVSLAWESGGIVTHTQLYGITGVPQTDSPRVLPLLLLRSRQFQPWDDTRIACVLASVADDTDPRNGGYHLVDLTTYSATALPVQWYGSMGAVGATPAVDFAGAAVPRVVVDQSNDLWAVPLLVASEVYSVRQVDVFAGSALQRPQRSEIWQTCEANGLLYLTGALTCVYDGQSVAEAGFAQAPSCTLTHGPPVPGSVGVEAGPGPDGYVYNYCVVIGWRDAAGNTHLSRPSAISTVRLVASGTDTRVHMGVYVGGPHASRKGVSPDGGSNPEARPFALIYRTEKDSSGPYRLLNTATQLPFPSDLSSVTYTDNYTDADLETGTRPPPYTSGGLLENHPVPSSTAICVHNNRVWIADAEDRKRLWFSKSLTPGEAPGFNLALTLRLDDSSDEIAALASLDEALLVFTKSRIYLVSGEGPNDQGQGAYPAVRLLSSSAGALDGRGVVRCEKGVFFQDASGLMLIAAQGALPVPAGLPVQETLRGRSIARVSHDAARRRLLWLLGNQDDITEVVVYDYRHDVWGVWYASMGDPLSDQTLWRGLLVWAAGDSVYKESPVLHTDGGNWVTLRVRTPWLHPSAIGGWQRTRRTTLRGRCLSGCQVHLFAYRDQLADGAGQTQVGIWSLPSGSPLLPDDSAMSLGMHMKVQKSQAVSFTIEDLPLTTWVPGDDSGVGIELYGLTLATGIHQGLAKLAAANRR